MEKIERSFYYILQFYIAATDGNKVKIIARSHYTFRADFSPLRASQSNGPVTTNVARQRGASRIYQTEVPSEFRKG